MVWRCQNTNIRLLVVNNKDEPIESMDSYQYNKDPFNTSFIEFAVKKILKT